jgi:cell division protein FtsQ
VQLSQAQDAVERLPWVERAQVRKRWPDTLEVTVVEHRPFARWGSERLLSVDGVLFPVPRNVDASALPQLGGPDAQVSEVVALYNQASALFAPMGLKVDALVRDARGSWSLKLDSGLDLVIGRADAHPRLQRFARLLPPLLGDPRTLQRADLRYTNGFALTWGEESRDPGLGTRDSVSARATATPATAREAASAWNARAPLLRVPSPKSRVPAFGSRVPALSSSAISSRTT